MALYILALCRYCGLREAVACARSRVPACWLVELWEAEDESTNR